MYLIPWSCDNTVRASDEKRPIEATHFACNPLRSFAINVYTYFTRRIIPVSYQ